MKGYDSLYAKKFKVELCFGGERFVKIGCFEHSRCDRFEHDWRSRSKGGVVGDRLQGLKLDISARIRSFIIHYKQGFVANIHYEEFEKQLSCSFEGTRIIVGAFAGGGCDSV